MEQQQKVSEQVQQKTSVATLLFPYLQVQQKKEKGEEITEEDIGTMRELLPLKMAYDELMRQLKKYQDVMAEKKI